MYDSCLRKEKSGTRGQTSNKDTEELQRAHGDKTENEDEDEDEDEDGDGGASEWVRVAARFAVTKVTIHTRKKLIASKVPVRNCYDGAACNTSDV